MELKDDYLEVAGLSTHEDGGITGDDKNLKRAAPEKYALSTAYKPILFVSE